MTLMYVIYENPKDFPGKFVVRKWMVEAGVSTPCDEPVAVVPSLYEARMAVPRRMVRIERNPNDDPVIVETWI